MSFAPAENSMAAVTAVAVRSCLGSDLDTIARAVASGRQGSAINHDHSFGLRSPMGLIKDPSPKRPSDERLMALFKGAIAEVLTTTELLTRYDPKNIGLVIGTTTFGYSQTADFLRQQQAGAKAPSSRHLGSRIGCDGLLTEICRSFELTGYSAAIGTACTSSAIAIHLAHILVTSGRVAACLAGGFDVVTPMTVEGFSSLQLLDEQRTRPFCPDRSGINLGEGGAMFVIEPDKAETENVAIGYLYGGASTCDAHDLTTPDPEATQIRRCIENTLSLSTMSRDDIALVNTHGTGTPLNDAAESLALSQVFGSRFEDGLKAMHAGTISEGEDSLIVHASKAYTGHLLGGAGALETALAMAAPIPDLDQTRPRLSCSFGFGGSNVCLAISPSPDPKGPLL